MSTPKRHHYIPQMLLKRFTDSSGKLHFFDKRIKKKTIRSANPRNLFLEKHLYAKYDKNGAKDVTLETDFANLEGEASQVIEKVVSAAREGNIPDISEHNRLIWNLFYYYQWKRTPDMLLDNNVFADFDNVIKLMISEFEEQVRPLTDSERADFEKPDVRKRVKQNARIQAVADPGQEVQKTLGKQGIAIAIVSETSKRFVIGSFPVVSYTLPYQSNMLKGAWLAIAPDIAISPAAWPKDEVRLIPITDDPPIHAMNKLVFEQSVLIAGNSETLIHSTANDK